MTKLCFTIFYSSLITFTITLWNTNNASCFLNIRPSNRPSCLSVRLSNSSIYFKGKKSGQSSATEFVNRKCPNVNLKFRNKSASHETKLLSRQSGKVVSETPTAETLIEDNAFNGRYTFEILFYQSLVIVVSVIAAIILNTPNYGLGANVLFDITSIYSGIFATGPLFLLAAALDIIEKYVPALQEVTLATQRSVLSLLGTKWKPFQALPFAIALGGIAGIGEEMLFRGIMQTWLMDHFGMLLSLLLSSLIFGAFHAVTPMYAFLTFVGSLYFGALYIASQDNLAIPIVCHAVYDVGVLMWAHYAVTSLTQEEQKEILE